jgi:Fe-S-cluster containining protein
MELADERSALARAWLHAMETPAVVLGLESIYTYVTAEIESRGPACWASGRCCHFEKTGHRLYVTGLEAAYTVRNRERAHSSPQRDSRACLPLSRSTIAVAREQGDCPFLERNLCGVHTIKPVGCRVYFCDRSAHEWQHGLSERAHERVRGLHDAHAIPYRYGEWRSMLEMFVA